MIVMKRTQWRNSEFVVLLGFECFLWLPLKYTILMVLLHDLMSEAQRYIIYICVWVLRIYMVGELAWDPLEGHQVVYTCFYWSFLKRRLLITSKKGYRPGVYVCS